MPDWYLLNVEDKAKEYAGQFFIPSLLERMSQKTGDLVGLHFCLIYPQEGFPETERMWIEITEVIEEGKKFSGVLTNQPVYIQNLKIGDVVHFEACHVARILIDKNDPLWVDSGEKLVLISKKCFDKGNEVRFIYCEAPDNDEDSGWRMLSGTESDADMNNPDMVGLRVVYWLLDWDPSLLPVLKNGKEGEGFERSERNAPWEKVNNWKVGR